ncbi:MAG: glycosyltransferase family 39 protein [Planctomycetes bacterium]|nr:glycosyltransferase family 39 protein [Planctomycetota bacterium]
MSHREPLPEGRFPAAGVLAAVLAGTALRVWRGWHEGYFEYDEYWNFYEATYSGSRLLRELSPEINWPPLGAFVVRAWTGLFGLEERAVRLLSVLVHAATAAALAGFLHAHAGRRAALAGAWLFALHPTLVTYGAAARAYSQLHLATVLALGGAAAVVRRPGPGGWALLATGAVLLPYLHFYGGILLFFLLATLLVERLRRRCWRSALGVIGVGFLATVAYLPYFAIFLEQLRITDKAEMAMTMPSLPPGRLVLLTVTALGDGAVSTVLFATGCLLGSVRGERGASRGGAMSRVSLAALVSILSLGRALNLAGLPVYHPSRQAVVFTVLVVPVAAALWARARPGWAAIALAALLAINTARLVGSAPRWHPAYDEHRGRVARILAHVRPSEGLYVTRIGFYQGFPLILEWLRQGDGRFREFWFYRPSYQERLVLQNLERDLPGHASVVVAAPRGPEGEHLIERIRRAGFGVEALPVSDEGLSLVRVRLAAGGDSR